MMVSPPMWRSCSSRVTPGSSRWLTSWVCTRGTTAAANSWPSWEDFHEIGVDVLNISQPNVNDIVAVGRRLNGRQCFMMPISYQTVSITGTPADIYAEAQRLYDLLGTPAGGFIGYVEEYSVMGMSAENYCACGEAFRRLRNP